MRRYTRVPLIKGGKQMGTSAASVAIRAAVDTGVIDFKQHVLQEGERLDIIAGREYGNASLWWILAGASAIGWSLQVPPGTLIIIPTSLSQVSNVVN